MELRNGKYYVQDLLVEGLGTKYDLPLFVYDADIITRQYNMLKDAFSVKNLTLNYACKALTNISILRHLRNLGAGLDAVSIGEVKIALQAGFLPRQIVFTPSSVSIKEYQEAVDLGVRINIDNLETLSYFGEHMPDLPVCVRINPHIMAGGNKKISVGHIDSKFGISIHQIDKITEIRTRYKMQIEGVHMHTGSDILNVQVFLQATDILFHAAAEFPDLSYIDFGSGFKVKYKPDDVETDIAIFGQEMSNKFNTFCSEIGRELELMFEPGKFLVSESGYFLAKTNVIKRTPSNVFVGLDSGFNHLIRPMFYDSYHGVLNISNPGGPEKIYSLVGYICETDTFAWNRPVPEVSVGDIIAFKNAGAYCYMMSSNYNTRCRPPEVLIHNGQDYLIREREQHEDLIRLQPDPQFT
ncbi:MAG: diaminopimelate decarboxylase [Saprospiraceae bacterium]|nr:diaminopimelate decarboxylase [Saprospiraceae bacterium]